MILSTKREVALLLRCLKYIFVRFKGELRSFYESKAVRPLPLDPGASLGTDVFSAHRRIKKPYPRIRLLRRELTLHQRVAKDSFSYLVASIEAYGKLMAALIAMVIKSS